MSKVADYLQSHLLGELYTRIDIRDTYASDGGILSQRPDMVVFPRNTNDVRKVMRFARQLAEKGHSMPLTVCGNGGDLTGASIGKGLILDLSRHMDRIYEYDAKQKLLRLQPGAPAASIQSSLRLNGTTLPALDETTNQTLGGAIGNDSAGYLSGSMGTMRQWVSQLEVVLDSGDVLQTGRISRREVNRLIGTQGRVGDIYRGIDTILEEHKEFIDQLSSTEISDRSGYPGIAQVRARNGSIDLTPLFIGSQGTLGVIVEAIVCAEYVTTLPEAGVLLFESNEDARDTVENLSKLGPSALEYYDGRFINEATRQGKNFAWLGDALPTQTGAMIWLSFHNFKQNANKKALKKAAKIAEKNNASFYSSLDHDYESLETLRSVSSFVDTPSAHADKGTILLGEGVYVSALKFESFLKGLLAIEKKLSISLPIEGSLLSSTYRIHPTLSMHRVSDKQKVFKLLDELSKLLIASDGALVGIGGEGRLLGRFAHQAWEDEYGVIVKRIRQVFDPHNILNPSTKVSHELKDLVGMLARDTSKRR